MQGIPVFTVSQLSKEISRLLQEGFAQVWVKGEVSNFRRSQSGHWYFDLKESGHLVSAVMFSSANRAFSEPCDGIYIMALGYLDFYGPWGATQLYCSHIQQLGPGEQAVALERLHAKLAQEGIFDASRKRSLPPFPTTIGVVTSTQGAALQDVLRVIERRFPLATVVISPTTVQGDDAPEQIVRALRALYQYPGIHVILLVRGGGSAEDLAPFNSEAVTREVFASPVPIVTGVGHSVDLSLADLAADLAAITPTQAAECATPDKAKLKAEVATLTGRAGNAVLARVSKLRSSMHFAAVALSPHKLESRVRELRRAVDRLAICSQAAVENRLHHWRAQVSRMETTATGCNPFVALNRGFALVRLPDTGKFLARAADATPYQSLGVVMRDGEILTHVQEVLLGTPSVHLRRNIPGPAIDS